MDYMATHGSRRARPAELVPGTMRVICARMNYLPRLSTAPTRSANEDGVSDVADAAQDWRAIEERRHADPSAAVISVYARGRDYHKVDEFTSGNYYTTYVYTYL